MFAKLLAVKTQATRTAEKASGGGARDGREDDHGQGQHRQGDYARPGGRSQDHPGRGREDETAKGRQRAAKGSQSGQRGLGSGRGPDLRRAVLATGVEREEEGEARGARRNQVGVGRNGIGPAKPRSLVPPPRRRLPNSCKGKAERSRLLGEARRGDVVEHPPRFEDRSGSPGDAPQAVGVGAARRAGSATDQASVVRHRRPLQAGGVLPLQRIDSTRATPGGDVRGMGRGSTRSIYASHAVFEEGGAR